MGSCSGVARQVPYRTQGVRSRDQTCAVVCALRWRVCVALVCAGPRATSDAVEVSVVLATAALQAMCRSTQARDDYGGGVGDLGGVRTSQPPLKDEEPEVQLPSVR